MRGVEIAVLDGRVFASPGELAVVGEHEEAAIVLIADLGVEQIAKDAFADHAEQGQGVLEVADVFEHHAGHAGLFGGADQIPAFLHGHGGRDFGARHICRPSWRRP